MMKVESMFRKMIIVPLTAGMMSLGAASSYAQVFNFDTFFSGDAGAPVTPGTFATLSVTTSDSLTYHFDLDIASNFNTVFGSRAIVTGLQVNTNNLDPTNAAGANVISGAGGVARVLLDKTTNSAGGVSWDYTTNFCDSSGACNAPPSAAGSLINSESVEWNLTFASTPTFGGSPEFLLRIQRIGADGELSAQYTPPIPEPEIYAMMIAGLGLMGFVARRRRQQTAAA